jgi:phenylalanyl-tRNA synthetase beta chain
MKVNDIEEQPVAIDGVSENKYTEYYFVNHLWSLLNNNYFYETKSFNMTSKEDVDKFNIFDYQNNVEIISSTNTNKQVLRNNLIHSMLNIYEYNQSYKNQLLPIFEIQKIYQEGQTGIKNLTLLTPKNVILDKTNGSKIVYDVNGLVGLVNEIVLNIFNNKVSYKPIANKYLYDNECLEVIFNNKVIGYIGSIKRVLLNAYNINEDIYVATLN